MSLIPFFVNNVSTTLSAAATSTATTLSLSSTAGLPTSIPAGFFLPLTLNDVATGQVYEIVYVTTINGTNVTVERAQESTGAQAWNTGDYVRCSPTAGTVAAVNGNRSNPFNASNLTAATGVFNNIQVFTSSGTFTVPVGVTTVRVTVVGGGGGGGGSSGTTSGQGAGGGGAGGAAIGVYAVTSGAAIAVTIGAAGTAGGAGGNGGGGGTSSFGSFATATGGTGGQASQPVNAAGGASGAGSGGTYNFKGGAGGDGTTNATASGGMGGNGIFGGAGRAATSATPAAQDGQARGAGGGAGYQYPGVFGGAGAFGIVIVEW